MISGRHFQHFDAKLVAEYAGIREERLPACEGVQIGAAHADAVNADEGFMFAAARRRTRRAAKVAGLFEDDLTHLSTGSLRNPARQEKSHV
jgi:hypothetical protein